MRRFPLILLALALLCIFLFVFIYIPTQVVQLYGPPAPQLTLTQRVQYSIRLFWHDDLLIAPADPNGTNQSFTIGEGEPVTEIAERLEQTGLILDAGAFRDYLIYTGLDTSLQAGSFELSPSLSIVDIARAMQDATPLDVSFVVLSGWRMEEIAASLPTSGLDAAPEQFLASARDPLNYNFLDEAFTNEGFFLPDAYILPRATDADGLVEALVRNFALHLTRDMETGFSNQNLTVYQAVILASLIEREAMVEEEMPLIASVFLNRLYYDWRLESDPTVQYAVGYDPDWWPNPLSFADLDFDSPYNTHLYAGLPPAPIANPSLAALRAVANPAATPYFFFRARCDDSGLHNFAMTLEEHIENGCE
jgi:UPF0755 protein